MQQSDHCMVKMHANGSILIALNGSILIALNGSILIALWGEGCSIVLGGVFVEEGGRYWGKKKSEDNSFPTNLRNRG